MKTVKLYSRIKTSHTFVNVHFQNLLLALHLLPVAVLAAVFGTEALSLALAVTAHALDLLDHPWPNLLNLDLNASTFAV